MSNAKADAAAAEYKKPPRAKGRPRGSKTKDRVVVQQVLIVDPCPGCGCKEEAVLRRLVREGDCDVTIGEQRCTHYRHETASCPNPECGQAFTLKTYTPS